MGGDNFSRSVNYTLIVTGYGTLDFACGNTGFDQYLTVPKKGFLYLLQQLGTISRFTGADGTTDPARFYKQRVFQFLFRLNNKSFVLFRIIPLEFSYTKERNNRQLFVLPDYLCLFFIHCRTACKHTAADIREISHFK